MKQEDYKVTFYNSFPFYQIINLTYFRPFIMRLSLQKLVFWQTVKTSKRTLPDYSWPVF